MTFHNRKCKCLPLGSESLRRLDTGRPCGLPALLPGLHGRSPRRRARSAPQLFFCPAQCDTASAARVGSDPRCPMISSRESVETSNETSKTSNLEVSICRNVHRNRRLQPLRPEMDVWTFQIRILYVHTLSLLSVLPFFFQRGVR
jgi:hypothetical protein